MALIKKVFFLFFVFILLLDENGYCSRSFLLANKKGKGALSFSIDFGGSYNFRGSRFVTILTSPDFTLGEGHFTVWYRNMIGLYFVYGASVGTLSTPPTIMGGGIKLPILNLVGGKKSGLINGISIRLIADYVLFQLPPDQTGTQIYATSGGILRYGGSLNWGLFSSPLYLDTTAMLARYSDVLFICPYIGLGFQF